jgi:3-methyladenine DNA glycosylase/8-oxoguanine DNA glycosylase
MLLIFNLGRPDVLPVHDLGVRRGFLIAYKRTQTSRAGTTGALRRTLATHRTTAALYLWRAADFLKDGEW